VRPVAADDLTLSPYFLPEPQGKTFAAIAAIQVAGAERDRYFTHAEEIFLRHGGRPHWGKVHSLTQNDLRDLYPKWNDYQALRRRLDPTGVFVDRYYGSVLGPIAATTTVA
jgi:FAD/FMN-containing dehydrogenase